ncbi:MAG: UDP-N-acetylglucosamine 2-epimerase (non-hydrolyzing) [bacterium]
MKKNKIMSIFGTRPEAIKMAPVLLEMRKRPDRIESIVVVTGQHREMLDQVLALFSIEPDVDLNIMLANQSLEMITSRAIEGLENVFGKLKPDLVLVQGDTTTAFVAALAAFYHKIAVGHVEAGLRTDNKYDPFPEEINRRLITVLGNLHFAPTPLAVENLMSNGIRAEAVYRTGNTVIDALNHIVRSGALDGCSFPPGTGGRRMLLVETHRRENLGAPMQDICEGLKKITGVFPDVEILFSVHKNPKVREVVYGVLQGVERVHLLEPMDYRNLVFLMKESYLILTDSGGIQEEAPALGKPVLVLRKTTERPEGIDAGTARLIGTDRERVFEETSALLNDAEAYRRMSQAVNPYGDGKASGRIVRAILFYFGMEPDRPEEFVPGRLTE